MAKAGLVDKAKLVMTNPFKFFQSIKSEGIKDAFKYLALLSLVYMVVLIIAFSVPSLSILGGAEGLAPLLGPYGSATGVALAVVLYIMGLVLSFVSVGIIHLFVKLMKGKGDYGATYKALIYASTPSMLLGWIPYIGTIIGLYTLYLELKGVSILHKIGMGRALLAVLVIPVVVIFVLVFAVAYLLPLQGQTY